jgi:hydrogenase maturation protease
LITKTASSSILVLALGNDILGDDAAGLEAVKMLRGRFEGAVDFCDTIESGLVLMDIMAGYDRVLLLDTIVTGRYEPGTIIEFSKEDFSNVLGPSPHCMGLPEVIQLADRLRLDFPSQIHALALEILMPTEFSTELTPPIEKAIGHYVKKAAQILNRWVKP